MTGPKPQATRDDRPIILIGAGGHARVLLEAMPEPMRQRVAYIADANPARHGQSLDGVPIPGGDELILKQNPGDAVLVNAIGSTAQPHLRQRMFEMFTRRGFTFASVVHPRAIVAGSVTLGPGVQVMAGAVIQPGATLGDNALVNTRAVVEHDGVIGAHCHIAPGVTLSGAVTIGPCSHIGAGATVIQSIRIGELALVGAGAVVVHDVPARATVMGVPARVTGELAKRPQTTLGGAKMTLQGSRNVA